LACSLPPHWGSGLTGHPVALSSVGDHNQLSLEDKTGKIRASLGVSKKGPRLTLFGETGKAIWPQS